MTFLFSLQLLLTGFGLGLVISAPVGPVNILCIQRTLARGFWAGVAIGAGAICADFVISAMAALGISALSGLMKSYEVEIQMIGGLILIGFGLKIFFSHPKLFGSEPGMPRLRGHVGAMPQSFLLTITNPGAILGIFAIFGSVSSAIGGFESHLESLMILTGLLLGASFWWICLTRLIAAFRGKMTEKRLELINKIAGLILAGGGAGLIVKNILF